MKIPIAGALFVATCLGTPVIALTGLKMGMFAAMGGGIMGFATGKLFADHEYEVVTMIVVIFDCYSREKQAQARGKYGGDDNSVTAQVKKKKALRRIHEWQRFEANCRVVRELDDDQIIRISEMHREMSKQSTPVRPKLGKEKQS